MCRKNINNIEKISYKYPPSCEDIESYDVEILKNDNLNCNGWMNSKSKIRSTYMPPSCESIEISNDNRNGQ